MHLGKEHNKKELDLISLNHKRELIEESLDYGDEDVLEHLYKAVLKSGYKSKKSLFNR